MSGVPPSGAERGIALAIALFALVVMSALVAGGLLAGRLEQQSGRNTLFAAQARQAAEAGLANALTTLAPGTLAMLPVGAPPSSLEAWTLGPGFRVEREVSRLTSTLFLVRVQAVRLDAGGGSLAVQVVGGLLRLVPDPAGGASHVALMEQRAWVQLH